MSALPLEVSPRSLRLRASDGGLRSVDELVRSPDARGFVFVEAAASVLDAMGAHVERRALALGRAVLRVDGLPSDDVWREVAVRLSIAPPSDPLDAAEAILDRAGNAVIVVREASPTCWGRALAAELARLAGRAGEASSEGPRALVVSLGESSPAGEGVRVIEVDAAVSQQEARLWWEAIAGDAERQIVKGIDRVDALESWWSAARATPADRKAAPIELGASAARLLARVALSQRSWLVADLGRISSERGPRAAVGACEELIAKGLVTVDAEGRLVSTGSPAPAIDTDEADAIVVAEALDAEPDPWAAARAAELHASAGAFDRAEASAVRALSLLTEPSARADFWRRWERALAALPSDQACPRLLRAAELALRLGDFDRAVDFARGVAARSGLDASGGSADPPLHFDVLLTLGRTSKARGDLTSAAVALGKALDRAPSRGARARVAVEIAEARWAGGDFEGAQRHAESALVEAGDALTRLDARNVIGKVHLHNSAWALAEEHFAADACEAALSGDLTSELRARLNRGIALLSSGRLDDARAMLTAVLEDGERHKELRAVAYALTNLATVAILKRDYPEAFRLSERAFEVRRIIGDKLSLALLITNIAELRLQIGQIAEAESALAFGRKACGPAISGTRLAHFSMLASRIHLARGDTMTATSEIEQAIASIPATDDGNKISECHRVAARIALEDGDVARATAALARAREAARSDKAHAETALLEAMRLRAAGDAFGATAQEALELAREAKDSELAREAHVLLHFAALHAGDHRAARAHVESAAALRDSLATALPDDMRARFLARRELGELAALEAARSSNRAQIEPSAAVCDRCGEACSIPRAGEPASCPECDGAPRVTLRSDRVAQATAPRRIVGRDPAIATLLHAIQKVGPSDATVLIRGESGTGKELVAEAIHEASPRRGGQLVKVNCAALVETLLLSELFGHEKGSFTGASSRKRGRFEMAEGGTLFLDEIGDISPRTQVALLRVLQEKTFERVGGVTPIQANVRIVCATHRDLRAMVARGEFREDLYYRLRGIVLEVPALRNRLGDLPAISGAILSRIAVEQGTAPKRLSARAIEGLSRHAWPGNVRELDNALRAAALFAEGDTLELHDFTSNVDGLRGIEGAVPAALRATDAGVEAAASAAPSGAAPGGTDDALASGTLLWASNIERSGEGSIPPGPSSSPTDVAYAHVRGGVSLSDLKRQIERDCIARALSESGGNITRAAGLLGMKRPRLSQLVKQYGFGGDGLGADCGGLDADSEES